MTDITLAELAELERSATPGEVIAEPCKPYDTLDPKGCYRLNVGNHTHAGMIVTQFEDEEGFDNTLESNRALGFAKLTAASVNFVRQLLRDGIDPYALRAEVVRLRKNRKHIWWGAGEADCPSDIKASNGELFALRCKTCGGNDPDEPCSATDEETDDYTLIMRQGDLLTRTVNILRGQPAPLHAHSHHDIPELAAALRADAERYRWLRPEDAPVCEVCNCCDPPEDGFIMMSNEQLDTAIDAAIRNDNGK